MTSASDQDGAVPSVYLPDELESAARRRLSPEIFDFIAGGAGDEFTVRENQAAFRRYLLRPRVLTGVTQPDVGTTLLGARLAAPLFVAPMGRQCLAHPDGERATAAAAARTGVGYVLSTASSVPLEDVARVGGPAQWFQLYVLRDRDLTARLVARAEAAGFSALCVTVDAPVVGLRPRDLRHGGADRARVGHANLPGPVPDTGGAPPAYLADANEVGLRWSDLTWLRGLSSLPLVVKGILDPADATRAVQAGADAIWVSNHGGRQLARVPGTVDVVAEVVAAVGGRVPVLLDGGVRHASDIVVALSLGATAVGVGRPVLWALACGGQPLVEALLQGLVDDLRRTMVLLGRGSLADLDAGTVARRPGHADAC